MIQVTLWLFAPKFRNEVNRWSSNLGRLQTLLDMGTYSTSLARLTGRALRAQWAFERYISLLPDRNAFPISKNI